MTSQDQDLSTTLADGRTLSYTSYGTAIDPGRPTLFYLHGFPGTHHEGLPVHEACIKRAITVIGITRPGFGRSTHQKDRSILSFVDDVVHLADHLDIKRFAILGISGGGPYALACLHAIPADRLVAVAVVSSVWPVSLGMVGMMMSNRILFTLAPWAPNIVKWIVDRELGGPAMDTEHPERFQHLMTQGFKRWPQEDQDVIFGNGGAMLDILTRSSREAIKDGTQGFALEAKLFGNPWGFALEHLPVDDGRLVIWHGAKDINIPVFMADQASKLMHGAEYRRYKDEAHLSLCVKYTDNILDFVEGRLKASAD
ncbi:Alpha/Beta hydrolase protein [Stachybotrys elegans]|uniref:Alpha/Beta hydrolase protein n=1 Tax=Stachybotrys elegans TaxID=80388 RepID=A0A8K0SMT4_9HYPO|nr:Alpha/Beta hydrolase protein [Stachybotrys elegans]